MKGNTCAYACAVAAVLILPLTTVHAGRSSTQSSAVPGLRKPPVVKVTRFSADGTSVNTFVMLATDGEEWVARSPSSAEGDLELRIRASARSPLGHTVTGTIRGTGIDVGLNSVTRDVRVTLSAGSGSGPAVLEGETLSPLSAFVAGRGAGTLRFLDSRGAGCSCTVIQWAMQPY